MSTSPKGGRRPFHLDPDAKLYRKGKTASELRYVGHTLIDNRHGLAVNARVTRADGHAERDAAKMMFHNAWQAAEDLNIEIILDADNVTTPMNSSRRANR
jgi:hypothetical protein